MKIIWENASEKNTIFFIFKQSPITIFILNCATAAHNAQLATYAKLQLNVTSLEFN